MRGQSQGYSFPGVDVGLPSKVRGSEAEEEWQEVDWVTWSTGELTVDGDSFLLVFKPSGGTVKAKPLGALIRASLVQQDEEGRTLVVTTSDAINRLYRLTFQSTRHAGDFSQLAERAEAAQGSSAASGQPDEKQREAAEADARSRLEADIRAALAAAARGAAAPAPPLVFGGAELCGPDPSFEGGSEVLLGRGAVVLLDPPDDGRVGSYELIFYGEDEGAREPVKRVAIGPKTSLRRAEPEGTPSPDSPAVTFRLQFGPQGAAEPAHALAFEDGQVAEAFARDFRVRQRLMDLSLKTVKRARAAEDLRGELEGLKQRSLFARLRRLVSLLLLLSVLATLARLAWLYQQDKGARAPIQYLQAIVDDAGMAVRLSGSVVANVAVKVCEAVTGTVSPRDLWRCLAAPGGGKALQICVEQLVGPAPDWA